MKVVSPVEVLPPTEVFPASLSNEIKADIIEDIADYLEQYDWVQGKSGWEWTPAMDAEYAPPACLSGAAMAACWYYAGAHNIPVYQSNLHLVDRMFYTPVFGVFHDVLQEDPVSWNDNPIRNKQEVLDLCRRLAKDLRG